MPESFIAEVDDCAPGTLSHPATNKWGVDMEMETDWEQERLAQEKTIQRILSQRDPKRIKEAIEAYKRDLPQLLRDDKERCVVAYDGSTQVGIAESREKLLADLKRKGLANNNNLFIKIVSSLKDSKETSCSSNHL
jgi:hypothetical protein